MSDDQNSAIADLKAARDRIEARLLLTSDYQALLAIDKAIEALQPKADGVVPRATTYGVYEYKGMVRRALTQGDAAYKVLSERKEPMYIYELLEGVRKLGVTVSGDDKAHINLSSMLSRDKRFRNIKYAGQYRWWVTDRPYPGETNFEEKKESADLLG